MIVAAVRLTHWCRHMNTSVVSRVLPCTHALRRAKSNPPLNQKGKSYLEYENQFFCSLAS